MKRSTIGIFFTFALLALTASAQTPISGQLSGTLGPDTYLVTGDCEIPQGEILTIQAGTTFLFNGHHYWLIYGTLITQGTESDSIVFMREIPTQANRWGGLRFMAGAPDNSFISYCLIDNCKNEAYPHFYGGGLYSDGVDLIVTNTTIQHCLAIDGGGFYGWNGANVTFIECVIADNDSENGAGLFYDFGTSGEVTECQIVRNTSNGT